MAKNETHAVPHPLLAEDDNILAALTQITTYKPANPDFATDKISALQAEVVKLRDAKAGAEAALMAAKDLHTAATWAYHNAILQAKNQIRAQFGTDSIELQSVGLKRASERKRPATRKGKG